jgi:hypothetical protein
MAQGPKRDWKDELEIFRHMQQPGESMENVQEKSTETEPRPSRSENPRYIRPGQTQKVSPFITPPPPEPPPSPSLSQPPSPQSVPRPQSSFDSIEVNNSKLTIKSPSGDVVINLTKKHEDEFIAKALKYQQAIINEKRANAMSTFAMAALSGLSAAAIGLTLIRSAFSKGKVSVIDT